MSEVNLTIFEISVKNYASVVASGYPLNTEGVLHSFENPLPAEKLLARTLFRQQAIREHLKDDAFKRLFEEQLVPVVSQLRILLFVGWHKQQHE